MNALALNYDENASPLDSALEPHLLDSEPEVEILKKNVASSTGIARRDPLGVYMRETKRYPLLTREEEHELAVRLVEEGDTDAARRLVESNLRLVVKIAYQRIKLPAHSTIWTILIGQL